MQLRSATLMLLVTTALASLGCGSNPAGPSEVQPAEALIRALRQQGATVVRMERKSREAHCLSVGALRIVVDGQDVLVFEYTSADAASRDASTVSRDGGTIGRCAFLWIAPPRFHKKDRLIVLYVGTNQNLTRTLDGLLGPPFAGR